MSAIVSASGKTRLRAALERAQKGGAPCTGQWMEFPGYTLARTIAGLGYDWVLIDCEHGNISDNEMYLMIGAITASGASPIVRVPAGEVWLLKRAMDAGAHGIMVPMCETPEQVTNVVSAMKYPSARWPSGIRGTGAMFAPQNFQQDGRQYLETANENVMVLIQIETKTAVENCEAIADVDGVDMLFVGPNDLAASLGYFAFDHASIPEVQDATSRVLAAAQTAGKFTGHFALSADLAAQKVKQGFEFVNVGADIVAMTAWMAGELGKLKGLLHETRDVEKGIEGGEKLNGESEAGSPAFGDESRSLNGLKRKRDSVMPEDHRGIISGLPSEIQVKYIRTGY